MDALHAYSQALAALAPAPGEGISAAMLKMCTVGLQLKAARCALNLEPPPRRTPLRSGHAAP